MKHFLHFLFRADKTNVGDWWCTPIRYFPFKPSYVGDILNKSIPLDKIQTLIIGGGGIGSDFFKPYLQRIKKANIQNTILWGAGVDVKVDKTKLLKSDEFDLYGDYFDFIDEVGIRVYSSPQKFTYVPCVSCMDHLFFKYRDVKPKNLIGVYSHKKVNLFNSENKNNFPIMDNSGLNLEEKLNFISNFEYIITNTYHGVYWATLLERKVIVLPFKSGLYSFKYRPEYCYDGIISDDLMNKAKTYHGTLEEARKLNFDFYKYLADKYDLV